MDAYTASRWRPPTQPIASSILKSKKKKLNLAQAPDMHAPKTVTLQTISENHPLTTNSPDSSKLRREITALRKQCEILEAQRNDAFEALDKLASAPQDHVSAYVAKIKDLESQRNDALEAIDKLASAPQEQNQVYLAKIKELEAQRNDAFEALDQVVSAPQPQATAHLAQIRELEAQKRILEERCKSFSTWAEQKRLESSKYAAESQRHKETCEQLNEALTDFYTKHQQLYAQHQELSGKLQSLQESMAKPTPDSANTSQLTADLAADLTANLTADLKAAQTRATNAEKTVQTLLGVRALVQSAPVALELSSKTRSILQSSIDVLSLANAPNAPKAIQSCLTQVCSALANLGDEAAGHSVVARGWLTKRDSVLRTSQPNPQ